jgi:hypothetical protein
MMEAAGTSHTSINFQSAPRCHHTGRGDNVNSHLDPNIFAAVFVPVFSFSPPSAYFYAVCSNDFHFIALVVTVIMQLNQAVK